MQTVDPTQLVRDGVAEILQLADGDQVDRQTAAELMLIHGERFAALGPVEAMHVLDRFSRP